MLIKLPFIVCSIASTVDEKKKLSGKGDDFFEYTRGKKIPPEGIPGYDFSDPESIVEFTRYISTLFYTNH